MTRPDFKETSHASKLPRFSIIVMGYNQEACIKDAIKSVLEQTYEGQIEIILSDDCSSDSTYQIMCDVAEQYKGDKRIILNRMPENAGRGKHLAAAISKASYEWIVRQDGDDFSFPHRCSMYAQAILQHPDAILIRSQFITIETNLNELPVFVPPEKPDSFAIIEEKKVPSECSWYGAIMVIKKDFFGIVKEWPITACFEDDLHGLYAWSIGHIYDLMAPTYFYTLHDKNISTLSSKTRFRSIKSAFQSEKKLETIARFIIETKKIGLGFCEEMLRHPHPATIRSHQEWEIEIKQRNESIQKIETDLMWWEWSLPKRLQNRLPGIQGLIRCLPKTLYASAMVLFFKLVVIKHKLEQKTAKEHSTY